MPESYRTLLKLASSDRFAVHDKHEHEHHCCLHEMNRFVALQPIAPLVSVSDEHKKQLRDLALGKLPQ
jgi:hypothetical protein